MPCAQCRKPVVGEKILIFRESVVKQTSEDLLLHPGICAAKFMTRNRIFKWIALPIPEEKLHVWTEKEGEAGRRNFHPRKR